MNTTTDSQVTPAARRTTLFSLAWACGLLLSGGVAGFGSPIQASRSSAPSVAIEAPFEGAALVRLTDRSFGPKVLGSSRPVVVEFSAPWCPGCRAAEPFLRRAAVEYGGVAVIATIDTDRFSYWANRFRVRALPTVLLVKDGRVVGRFEGGPSEPLLTDWLGSSMLATDPELIAELDETSSVGG